MATGETISIRKFADKVGVSDTTIHKAIDSFKIVKGVKWNEDKTKKIGIYYDVAVKEWNANRNPVDRVTRTGNALNLDAIPGKGIKHDSPATDKEDPNNSLVAIRRATAFVDLKLKNIELEKRKGLLIDKAEVNKALFDIGKKIREDLLAIPDRVIDDILSSQSRHEAHTLLFKELELCLETLSAAPRVLQEITPTA